MEKLRLPSRLELRLGKWQLILLMFVFVYAFLVILNLNYIPIQWDELNHFNCALLLIRGKFGNTPLQTRFILLYTIW